MEAFRWFEKIFNSKTSGLMNRENLSNSSKSFLFPREKNHLSSREASNLELEAFQETSKFKISSNLEP
jgi:hypothetical protein